MSGIVHRSSNITYLAICFAWFWIKNFESLCFGSSPFVDDHYLSMSSLLLALVDLLSVIQTLYQNLHLSAFHSLWKQLNYLLFLPVLRWVIDSFVDSQWFTRCSITDYRVDLCWFDYRWLLISVLFRSSRIIGLLKSRLDFENQQSGFLLLIYSTLSNRHCQFDLMTGQ